MSTPHDGGDPVVGLANAITQQMAAMVSEMKEVRSESSVHENISMMRQDIATLVQSQKQAESQAHRMYSQDFPKIDKEISLLRSQQHKDMADVGIRLNKLEQFKAQMLVVFVAAQVFTGIVVTVLNWTVFQ